MRRVSRSFLVSFKVSCSSGLALGILALPAVANAQIADGNGKGLDTHLFRPAIDSKGLFATNGSDILGAGDLSFGLVIDYGKDLLRTSDDRKGDSRWLIDHSFQGTA